MAANALRGANLPLFANLNPIAVFKQCISHNHPGLDVHSARPSPLFCTLPRVEAVPACAAALPTCALIVPAKILKVSTLPSSSPRLGIDRVNWIPLVGRCQSGYCGHSEIRNFRISSHPTTWPAIYACLLQTATRDGSTGHGDSRY